ncbi:MAG: PD-(D/E)XK nuclease family protein [candidate division WOR-3 bacterium]
MHLISPSRIYLYVSCPRCFYLEVKKGIKRPVEFFPRIPSLLDKIFKEIAEEFKEKDLPYYFKRFGLKGKLKKIKLEDKKIENTDLILRGIPDEIIENEEKKILPLDYKTSSKFPDKLPIPVQIQLDSYSLLIRLNNFETNEKAFVFYFVPYYSRNEKRIRWDTKLYEYSVNLKRLKKFIIEIDKTLREDKLPEPSKSCHFCKYVEDVKNL